MGFRGALGISLFGRDKLGTLYFMIIAVRNLFDFIRALIANSIMGTELRQADVLVNFSQPELSFI